MVIYHSQTDKAAIGLGRVVRAPYPDPTDERGKRVWVDVQRRAATRPAGDADRAQGRSRLRDSMLVRQSRLSVVRLDDEQLAVIERRAGEPPSS